ncbi:MAG: Holo-[acyl-carrier-protein] synthase [Leptospirillum sp. Group II 'C75']|nr:MAG: Holo-[acyl-carrier-protein] synthase [Leptospirillum rubarum]EIJ76832.1 MAG: Holo-[acyl-carrier-protein] synthase [Leptospirillum sp. Group II 'C75']
MKKNWPSMSLVGIGTDIVSIRRIEDLICRFGERFLDKVFTREEVRESGGKPEYLAGRFAVKESVLKALGTGLQGGVRWKDIETLTLPNGMPYIRSQGRVQSLAESRGAGEFWVSLTHDREQAIAFVVLTGESD